MLRDRSHRCEVGLRRLAGEPRESTTVDFARVAAVLTAGRPGRN